MRAGEQVVAVVADRDREFFQLCEGHDPVFLLAGRVFLHLVVVESLGEKGRIGTENNLVVLVFRLGIDADQQGNTTSGLGLDKNGVPLTIYDVFLEQATIAEVKQPTCVEGLEVLPANISLTGAEIELIGKDDREYILKEALDKVKDDYDFVIIDCPPSLNLITINALTAADTVLVPIQCEYFALEGLEQLLHAVNLVRKRLNRHLEIEGIVFTMYDARTNLSLQVVEEVKRSLGENVYRSIIPRNVRLGEAPSHGLPIHLYDPKSKGAESYGLLAEEVMEKEWD